MYCAARPTLTRSMPIASSSSITSVPSTSCRRVWSTFSAMSPPGRISPSRRCDWINFCAMFRTIGLPQDAVSDALWESRVERHLRPGLRLQIRHCSQGKRKVLLSRPKKSLQHYCDDIIVVMVNSIKFQLSSTGWFAPILCPSRPSKPMQGSQMEFTRSAAAFRSHDRVSLALARGQPRALGCAKVVRPRVRPRLKQEGDLHVGPELGHLVVLDHGLELLNPDGADVSDRA